MQKQTLRVSGGSKEERRGRAPPRNQILSISCSFWENSTNSYVGAPRGVGAPSSGKSWIRHCVWTRFKCFYLHPQVVEPASKYLVLVSVLHSVHWAEFSKSGQAETHRKHKRSARRKSSLQETQGSTPRKSSWRKHRGQHWGRVHHRKHKGHHWRRVHYRKHKGQHWRRVQLHVRQVQVSF